MLRSVRGMTLLEVLITMTILMVLASITLPTARYSAKRIQELELRAALRQVRTAIDEFHRDWARDGDIPLGPLCVKNKLTCKEHSGITGYPKGLATLLGVELSGSEATVREAGPRRYLRRIPVDPITGQAEWSVRCYKDPPDTETWCHDDVFDVHSTSPGEALDQTRYRDW